jgi:uncharacterized protein (DUF362 family)
MSSDVVGLVKVADGDITSAVENALGLIGFKTSRKVESVFIKANLCYYWDSLTGYTTDRRLVSSLIDILRKKYGLQDADIKVVEADATAMRTSHVFKMLKYEELAAEKKVTLFNLSEDKVIEKTVNVNNKEISLKIPECLLNLHGKDLFINMPKMKIMSHTTISCAMKNLFGCMAAPRKIAYHPMLDEAIVAMNKVLKPDLIIVDGIVALSSFPVKMDLIVSGFTPFSVDWTVSRIMGYNPSRINHLRLARREGLGDSKDIVLKGEDLSELRKMWPHVNAFRLRWQNRLQLKLLRTYCRIVGDVIPPFLEV